MRMLLVTVAAVASLAAHASAQRFSSPKEQAPPTQPGQQPAPGGASLGGRDVKFPTGIYDEAADGAALVREAAARAKRENKRVLIMWGENYCGFCSYLMDLMTIEDPRIKAVLDSEYELVKLNIGKDFSGNRDLQVYYQSDMLARDAEGKGVGAPALTVVDPLTDKAAEFLGGNASVAKNMTVARVFDADLILGFLQRNIASPRAAMTTLLTAQQTAKREKKGLLLVFVRPGCDECARIKAWLADPKVQPTLAKAFVPATIDTERMIAGGALLARWSGNAGATAPWVAAVAGDAAPPAPGSNAPAARGWTALSGSGTDDLVAGLADAAGGGLTAEDVATLRAAIPPAAPPATPPAP